MPVRRKATSRGAQLLRQWRGEMHQVEASRLFNLDPSTYGKFENGKRTPGGRWMVRIEMLTNGAVPASSWHLPPQKQEVAA